MDPADFRDGLNATIQELRNVTFVLQSAKQRIPGFDEWYASQQDRMRSDPVLRWLVSARNTVVKQGELEIHSWLRADLIVGYDDEASLAKSDQLRWSELPNAASELDHSISTEPPKFVPLHTVHETFKNLDLPERIGQDASILYEREWRIDQLPDHELLTLLAYSYGQLRQVVFDSHRLMANNPPRVRELPRGGKQPCMLSTRKYRTVRLRFADDTEVKEHGTCEIARDEEAIARLVKDKPYGPIRPIPSKAIGNLQHRDQLNTLAEWYIEVAKGVVRSGQDHGWFTIYYRDGSAVAHRIHQSADAQGKRAIASEIARVAVEVEANAVLIVTEIWTGKMIYDEEGVLVSASRQENKGEALSVEVLSRSGELVSKLVPFERVEGEPPHRIVEMGNTQDSRTNYLGMFWPLASVWGHK